MSDLEFHWFALFAYAGAVLWASSFLSLGYFLGERWQAVSAQIHQTLLAVCVVASVLIAVYLVWRRLRRSA